MTEPSPVFVLMLTTVGTMRANIADIILGCLRCGSALPYELPSTAFRRAKGNAAERFAGQA